MTDKSNSQHAGKWGDGWKGRQARGRITGNGGFHSFHLLFYVGLTPKFGAGLSSESAHRFLPRCALKIHLNTIKLIIKTNPAIKHDPVFTNCWTGCCVKVTMTDCFSFPTINCLFLSIWKLEDTQGKLSPSMEDWTSVLPWLCSLADWDCGRSSAPAACLCLWLVCNGC